MNGGRWNAIFEAQAEQGPGTRRGWEGSQKVVAGQVAWHGEDLSRAQLGEPLLSVGPQRFRWIRQEPERPLQARPKVPNVPIGTSQQALGAPAATCRLVRLELWDAPAADVWVLGGSDKTAVGQH